MEQKEDKMSELIGFKVSPDVLEDAEVLAKLRKVNRSDLLRDLLMKEIGVWRREIEEARKQ